ncbi:glucosamine-6-phosphate deaminase [Alicyclobacillus fastidiosus]|nr:glucosamine-6-phosphate deaminase [Alicyclobacillus fastidiosus]GMA62049.1 glucosamine-6-phosphate deaminase [Alicyclobacillus fastidiosus]
MCVIKKFDRLNVKILRDRASLGAVAAKEVAEKMKLILSQNEELRMVFAAAPSQNEFLKELTWHKGIDWNRVTAFHMDEYVGLPDKDPRRFSQFLIERLFKYVNPGKIYTIDPMQSANEECHRYGDLIDRAPIDIVCLGIGENGHIAFNDPGVANFSDPHVMKAVQLDIDCRMQQVHDGCFPDLDSVPLHALTLTIPTLMSGHHLFCMVPGSTKRNAVERALFGSLSTECPASILRAHLDCNLYLDLDSCGDVGHEF